MEKPFVVCHMLSSIDGKIDGEFMCLEKCRPYLHKYNELRNDYQCNATLYGTKTMEQGYSEGYAPYFETSTPIEAFDDYIASSDVSNFIVSIDPKGILGWKSKYIEKKGRSRAHIIEVLSEQVSQEYLDYLHEYDISYIFAGKNDLNCSLIIEKLKKLFHIDRLMIAGGGKINWSFLQENLIDELSLLIVPITDGNNTSVSIFEQSKFQLSNDPIDFELLKVDIIHHYGLWLRYKPNNLLK